MNPKRFFGGLLLTAATQLVLTFLLTLAIPGLKSHLGFILVSVFVMMLFCTMLYAAARILVASANAKHYIQLIMIAVFLKMLVCLVLIIGYKKGFAPTDHTFVWPFLIIYVTSTVYEVVFLDKVGRQNKKTPS